MMNVKIRIFVTILLSIFTLNLITSTSVWGSTTFEVEKPYSIRPYLIRTGDERIVVKFQLAQDALIDVFIWKTDVNSGSSEQRSFQRLFKQGIVQNLDIGKQACDTKIQYEIRARFAHDAEENIKNSKIKAFPCSVDEEITFAFLTDTHAGFQNADGRIRQVTKAMNRRTMNESLSFVLNGGDFVPNGSRFSHWQKYFNFGSSYNSSVPLIGVVGNHDYGTKGIEDEAEAKSAALPNYFDSLLRWDNRNDYGNEIFSFPQFDLIVLNSNLMFLSDRMVQVDWLREKLIQAKNKSKFVIVCFHHAVFSTGGAVESGDGPLVRQLFVPLIQEYKSIVKLVLGGHVHMYERSVVDGVNYVVGGPSGGRKHTWFTIANPYKVFLDKKSSTFSVIKVSKNVVSLKSYNRRNKLIDEVVIQ